MTHTRDVHQRHDPVEKQTLHCLVPVLAPQDLKVTQQERASELRLRLLKMILDNEQQRKLHDYSTPKVQLQIDA